MSDTYKLVYFNGRGLAETSRLLFAVAEQEYEDFRYPLNIIDMKTYNMLKEEFDLDKSNNKLLGSLNKVPYLQVNDEIIPQSKAIERYIAKRFKLMGDSLTQEAQIDSICECVRDFKDLYQKVRKIDDEDKKKEAMTEWFTLTLPEKFKLLEHLLCKNNECFSVGYKLSLADVVLFSFITQFFDDKESALNSIKECDKIKNIVRNVENNENIKKWLNSRPITDI